MIMYAIDWKKCPDCGVTMPPTMLESHKAEQCQRWKPAPPAPKRRAKK